jgi:DNA modification methylase
MIPLVIGSIKDFKLPKGARRNWENDVEPGEVESVSACLREWSFPKLIEIAAAAGYEPWDAQMYASCNFLTMQVNQTNVLNGRMARGDNYERHICPLQLDVIERCITLYSNPGDLVLDPFNGIGSTGYQAVKMGRKYLGIELKPEYAKQASKFLQRAESEVGTLFATA